MTQQPARALPSPWLWVPSLYFAESIPNAVVSDTATFMYNDFGLTTKELGVVTGSMYLAWVLKPFWSPLVDLVKTKRWWILVTELVLALSFLGLAAAAHSPNWLFWTKVCLWTMAFASATQDISADGFYMLGLSSTQQAAYTGVRGTAYRLAMLCAKGFMVWAAGHLTKQMGVFEGWSAVLCVPGVAFLLMAFYHSLVLPRPDSDRPSSVSREGFLTGYADSFRTFFAKPRLGKALAFMLLFRLAEVQVLAMVSPFLTGKREAGGLGMTTEQVGIAYGTFGVIGIICGGILAGILVARYGLRKWYWRQILVMHVPNLLFLMLAYTQLADLTLISCCLFTEQFGYGFGFTVYILYLMYYSKGEQQTSHYAIATGFMALSLMLPKMISGYVQTELGFLGFFGYVAFCTLPSFLVAWLAWTDKDFIDSYEPRA